MPHLRRTTTPLYFCTSDSLSYSTILISINLSKMVCLLVRSLLYRFSYSQTSEFGAFLFQI